MQRRSFLAGLLALPAAGVVAREVTRDVPKVDVSPYLTSKDAWHLPDWPGSVNVKTYHRTPNRLMTAAQMRELLEPGLNRAFSAVYGSDGL